MPDPTALAAPLRADVHRGAAELSAAAAEAFSSLLAEARGDAPEELARSVHALSAALEAAQPAMAPIRTMCRAARRALDDPPGEAASGELADRIRQAVDDVATRVREAPGRIAAHAGSLLPVGARILTLSSSSTVRETLLAVRPAEVVCLEGRPNLEGRRLARALAEAGVGCTVAVDAAAAALLEGRDALIVGADAIGDGGVVNKIGTRAAALAARAADVPALLLADTTKLLPPGHPSAPDDERPSAEVWADAPQGVRVWNRYFEATPLVLFTKVVTEEGAESPEEVEARRAALAE